VAALFADCRRRAVSGQQGHVVPQRPDPGPNRLEQLRMVTAREIRSPDRTLEDHVTDNRDGRLPMNQDDVSRRVPRAMQHVERLLPERDLVALRQPTVGNECLAGRKTELLTPLWQRFEQEQVVAVWALDRQLQFTRHAPNGTDMIEMTVRDQDLFDLDARLSGDFEDAFGFATGINDRCPAGGFTTQQRAVLLVVRDRNNLDIHKAQTNPAAKHLAKPGAAFRAGALRSLWPHAGNTCRIHTVPNK